MIGLISVYKDIKQTTSGHEKNVFEILERIRAGKSKETIFKIRNCPDVAEKTALKNSLPSIVFSGTFYKRFDSAIKQHSGLICLDYDKFPTEKELFEYRQILINSEYSFSVFISPSGNGLKQLVRIPAEKENHRSYFKALKEHFDSPYWDDNCINESRVCFESYDPEIYINKESKIWDTLYIDEHYEFVNSNPVLPLTNYTQIIQKLQVWFDKKFQMSNGQRNSSLFSFASALNDFGVPQSDTENYFTQYQQPDFKLPEIVTLIKSAYKRGEHSFGSKFFEDTQTKKQIENKVKSGESKTKIIKELEGKLKKNDIENVIDEINSKTPLTEFWSFDKGGHCKISNNKFKSFLEQNGFFKLYPNQSDSFIFIRVENNLIENSSSDLIKDFVLDYLNKNKFFIPYEIMTSNLKYFNDNYLNLIDAIDISFFEDTRDSGVIYFKNGAAIIKADSIELVDYLDLDGFIWKKHVIAREYKKVDFSGCVYERFISKIANDIPERMTSLKTTIGYLLHSFKTSADNKAIILNDETISENPNGGSGKGIFFNALSKIKRLETLDGKIFSNDKSFAYQTVGVDTQILVFDDVKRTFLFENIFSLITEGITLEKKNKDAIKLNVSKSPKILITTNYTIGGLGGSFERRKWEVEFSSYFNANHTPLDEFGHLLFDEWNEEEWQKFDNFMIDCLQLYLKNGLVKFEFHNINTKKFIKETCFEFYEWVTEQPLDVDFRIYKSAKFIEFKEEFPDINNQKWITQKRFSQWLEIYGNYMGYIVSNGKTDSGRWIKYEAKIKKESKEIKPRDIDIELTF